MKRRTRALKPGDSQPQDVWPHHRVEHQFDAMVEERGNAGLASRERSSAEMFNGDSPGRPMLSVWQELPKLELRTRAFLWLID
jgi:hypothetical protein